MFLLLALMMKTFFFSLIALVDQEILTILRFACRQALQRWRCLIACVWLAVSTFWTFTLCAVTLYVRQDTFADLATDFAQTVSFSNVSLASFVFVNTFISSLGRQLILITLLTFSWIFSTKSFVIVYCMSSFSLMSVICTISSLTFLYFARVFLTIGACVVRKVCLCDSIKSI